MKKHSHHRIYRPREQGAALIVVMVILLVLTLVGMGAINTASREYTITTNRTYGDQASQVAKAGLHMAINHFRRNPSLLRVLQAKIPAALQKNDCDKAQVICMTAASFFPSTTGTMKHRAFTLDAFISRNASLPKLYADFIVKIHSPVKSVFTKPMAGFSINNGSMCTYTVTFTGTGYIRDPSKSNVNSIHATVAEKSHKAYIQVMATGHLCN